MPTHSAPPRWKKHLRRSLCVLALLIFAFPTWRIYDQRAARAEATALGWTVYFFDPSDIIREDWKATFDKGAWFTPWVEVTIPPGESLEQHLSLLQRLSPKHLYLQAASTMRYIPDLEHLPKLEYIHISDGTSLTNINTLKKIHSLKWVKLSFCPLVSDVDAVKSLPALQKLDFIDCPKLTKDTIADLQATIPNIEITNW